jgi:Vitamin B12 dependent methionine synthase, activation domain
MTGSTFQYNFKDLKLTVSQIESFMGYKQGESFETISDLISEVLREAETICTMKVEYRIFENIVFDDNQKTVTVKDLIFNINKIIYGQIKKSDSAAFFLCTAGSEIGARSKNSMKEGDLLRGYVYDVVGSEAVEAAADLMQNQLEEELKLSGRKITNRFSPGYCGWMVVEQHKLFELMPDNFCGIRLTPSALMDPIKSVSGIIGIGKNVKRAPYACSFCDMKDCIYRRLKV